MNLNKLGLSADLSLQVPNGLGLARVITEHRERYLVHNGERELEAEILGNLRYSAQSRADFPAVGDWVAISEYDDGPALIHQVLERQNFLARSAVGAKSDQQIIATNVDVAFIVLAVDRDFSINRIQRYLTICNSGGIEAVIILNKIDLISESALEELHFEIKSRLKDQAFLSISLSENRGLEALNLLLQAGKTYCLLGSSGVGKSSLMNSLAGSSSMKTDHISESTQRGRHVTTHRELKVLENGSIFIDNPGMREIGITDNQRGMDLTFEEISSLSEDCKYKDCQHLSENGCAVLAAVENGDLSEDTYQNFLKMEREKAHYESTQVERRRKDKQFGKMVREVKKRKGHKP